VSLDDIRALQEELQKTQLAESSAKYEANLLNSIRRVHNGFAVRLSKRNCVQLIMKLQELKLIELMYTADGKVAQRLSVLSHPQTDSVAGVPYSRQTAS
jgi:hypothetical protein